MHIAELALWAIILFIFHEFEEIICFHAYTHKHTADPHYQNDPFVRHKTSFASAETVAIMIAEEFILVALLLGVAIWLNSFTLVIATIIVNVIHLLGHIGSSLYYRRMLPGSWTAAATLGGNTLLLLLALPDPRLHVLQLAILTPFIGILVGVNLQLIVRCGSRIEQLRKTLI